MVVSLAAAYRQRTEAGELKPDQAQDAAVAALGRLEADLNALSEPGFSLSLFKRPKTPRGVYLWGPVGRGKSMIMDLFFDSAPVEKKRRVHFQAFMAEVHAMIDQWRKGDMAQRKALFGQSKGDDPIRPTAERVAERVRLLCFDELQVVDIADAMILGRLFEALFEEGVVLVATSNRAPDDLYKDGLNRQLFLPFIAMLKERMDVVAVRGPTDFRLDLLRAARVYFAPLDRNNEAGFDRLWAEMVGGAPEDGATLVVMGRQVRLPRAVGGLVRASFMSLCATALGPQDYLAIADQFHTVFLEAVPKLTPERRNEARRLINLIDALYEARTRLVVLAAAEPDALYATGQEAFAFERTASRLHEMGSAAWLEAADELVQTR